MCYSKFDREFLCNLGGVETNSLLHKIDPYPEEYEENEEPIIQGSHTLSMMKFTTFSQPFPNQSYDFHNLNSVNSRQKYNTREQFFGSILASFGGLLDPLEKILRIFGF